MARMAIDLTVRGARRVPAFRERVFRRLSETVRRSYVETEPNAETLALDLWFGRKLEPFLCRMLAERPRAAKKLVHLLYVWAQDVRRRSAQRADGRRHAGDRGHRADRPLQSQLPAMLCRQHAPGRATAL